MKLIIEIDLDKYTKADCVDRAAVCDDLLAELRQADLDTIDQTTAMIYTDQKEYAGFIEVRADEDRDYPVCDECNNPAKYQLGDLELCLDCYNSIKALEDERPCHDCGKDLYGYFYEWYKSVNEKPLHLCGDCYRDRDQAKDGRITYNCDACGEKTNNPRPWYKHVTEGVKTLCPECSKKYHNFGKDHSDA